MSGPNLILNRTHSDHSDMKEQIVQLLLAENIRKRAADMPSKSFLEICLTMNVVMEMSIALIEFCFY
jgi:hypothetical protein